MKLFIINWGLITTSFRCTKRACFPWGSLNQSRPPKSRETPPVQTYEGGLGGEPGNEAHGGYTHCGLAALLLLGRADALHVPRLVHWLVHRQVWL